MWNSESGEISYGVPVLGTYIGKPMWESEENKSKYFDLQKDMQAGLHLGSLEEMRREYVEQVCGGVPWQTE